MTGVMKNLELQAYSQTLYYLYFLVIISLVVLIAAENFLIRRLPVSESV